MPIISTETEVQIDVEVWCSSCGTGLCNLAESSGTGISVEPCPHCIKSAEETAHEEGKEEGRTEAQE